ncbi:ABC transporter permease [Paenibacillaceae bacterium]|nr:ABC transporter permease [Paenibacillaceae bacterium]
MTLFAFALIRSVRSVANLILLAVFPLAVIFLPKAEWDIFPKGYQYYGMLLLFSASKLVHLIMEDRKKKILTRIGAAPVTHFQYLLQNLLAFSLLLIVQCAVVTGGGLLVHGSLLGNPLQLFLVFSCFSLTAISFSLAWCSLFRHPESSMAVMFGFIMIMAMLGGTFVPLAFMPEFLQRIAMFVPTYWLTTGMEMAAANALFSELLTPLSVMLLFSILFVLIGSRRKLA